VIVPARNAGADLAALLECLSRQTEQSFELVIGDDGSDDGSIETLAQVDDPKVRITRGTAVNAYAARNRAVAESRGVTLAFCDADCRPAPDWIERGLAALGSADVIAGRIRFDIPEDAGIWSLLDAETTKDHLRQVQVGTAETANLFLQRELLDRVGPFDAEQPGYGDFEFVLRCVSHGAKLVFAEDVVVTHPVRKDARSFLRNVWSMNSSYAAFESRAGRLPEGLKLREWIPIVQTVRARRRFGMSLGLDRRWLGESGFRPTIGHDLRALPLTYLFLPYVRSLAQLSGWRQGKHERSAKQPSAPATPVSPG
jgi:glycosyltransferase involved in cell wall biosynthesis